MTVNCNKLECLSMIVVTISISAGKSLQSGRPCRTELQPYPQILDEGRNDEHTSLLRQGINFSRKKCLVYTTHHFLNNFMNGLNNLVCLSLENLYCQCNVTCQLIGPIHKLERKQSVVNMDASLFSMINRGCIFSHV